VAEGLEASFRPASYREQVLGSAFPWCPKISSGSGRLVILVSHSPASLAGSICQIQGQIVSKLIWPADWTMFSNITFIRRIF
jgi:hypothetical protein